MVNQDNHRDRLADRNLRMIGRRLSLPQEPSLRQREIWKRTVSTPAAARDAEHVFSPLQSIRFIRRHRLLALATSVAAAAIVMALLLVMPRSAVVQASTILNSLRQTLLGGFQIELNNLGQDGIHIDGQLMVTLGASDGPSGRAAATSAPRALRYESLYSDVRLWADESHDETAGLDVQATVALSDQAQWVYFKTSRLPRRLLEEEPWAWVLYGLTRRGVLLEFDGLLDTLRAPRSGQSQVNVAEQARVVCAADETGIEELFMSFLTGRASGDQIARVFFLVSGPARDVSIVEQARGRYILTAGDFALDGCAPDITALLGEMRLTVIYRSGSGLESAELTNLGQYGGTLRLSPLGASEAESMLDSARLVDSGVTGVCDLSVLKPLVQRRWRSAGD